MLGSPTPSGREVATRGSLRLSGQWLTDPGSEKDKAMGRAKHQSVLRPLPAHATKKKAKHGLLEPKSSCLIVPCLASPKNMTDVGLLPSVNHCFGVNYLTQSVHLLGLHNVSLVTILFFWPKRKRLFF